MHDLVCGRVAELISQWLRRCGPESPSNTQPLSMIFFLYMSAVCLHNKIPTPTYTTVWFEFGFELAFFVSWIPCFSFNKSWIPFVYHLSMLTLNPRFFFAPNFFLKNPRPWGWNTPPPRHPWWFPAPPWISHWPRWSEESPRRAPRGSPRHRCALSSKMGCATMVGQENVHCYGKDFGGGLCHTLKIFQETGWKLAFLRDGFQGVWDADIRTAHLSLQADHY